MILNGFTGCPGSAGTQYLKVVNLCFEPLAAEHGGSRTIIFSTETYKSL